jgi:O-antigen/teichoic acid export membrane protein
MSNIIKRYSIGLSRLFKDIITVGFSKSVIVLSGLGISILSARILGVENNGIIAAISVYPSIFMSMGSLGIRQAAAYYLGKGIYSETEVKQAIVQIWLLTSIISILMSFNLIFFLSDYVSITYAVLAILPIPFVLFNIYNSGIFLGKNLIQEFSRISWIPSFIGLMLTIGLVWIFPLGIEGFFTAAIGGPAFVFLYFVLKGRFIQYLSIKVDAKIIMGLLRLGAVYAVSLLLINLNYKIDVVLLDVLSTSYETGIYSKGVSLTQVLWHIPMIFSTIIFSRSASSKNSKEFSQKAVLLVKMIYPLLLIPVILIGLFAEELSTFLFGSEFRPSGEVIRLLLPGIWVLIGFKILNMDLAGNGLPRIAIKAMSPALLVNIILNYFLIPSHGANGAAVASSISYALSTILIYFWYGKAREIHPRQLILTSKEDLILIRKLFKK